MVDSRAKGAKAEADAKKKLRELTEYKWERIPSSGALSPVHGLKGDLYIPGKDNKYCVEVKHYADDQFTTKLLSSKSPIFDTWWEQAVRQANQVNKEPLLIFKYNRSKWFVAIEDYHQMVCNENRNLKITDYSDNKELDITVCLLTDFCKWNKEWLKQSTN